MASSSRGTEGWRDAARGGTVSRVMGIDFGLARIGVALSDPTRTLASPLGVIADKDKGAQIRRVAALVAEHEVAAVVVGLPLTMDGEAGEMAATVERFATKLEQVIGLPVIRWDERLSSVEAEELLRELEPRRGRRKRGGRDAKGRVDEVAAAIILRSWLEAGGPGA